MDMTSHTNPLVGVIMGSQSDWETMAHASSMLTKLGVAHECRVVSAHRTPDLLFEYASMAAARAAAGAARSMKQACRACRFSIAARSVAGSRLSARAELAKRVGVDPGAISSP